MVRLEQSVIMSREAQASDAALFRRDLPKSGAYSALDIGIRLTNGAASAINLDLLDVIKHISLVCNGNDYRFHISGQDMFRNHWLKNGRPMPYKWTESASGVRKYGSGCHSVGSWEIISMGWILAGSIMSSFRLIMIVLSGVLLPQVLSPLARLR